MGNLMPILRLTSKRQYRPNSVVLITGASEGLGREIAIQYS